MMSEVLALLYTAGLASSLVIVCVLLLRAQLRHLFGPAVAYAAWFTVPVALLALLMPAASSTLLPARNPIFVSAEDLIVSVTASTSGIANGLFAIWLSGALLCAAVLLLRQLQFVRGLGPLRVHDGLAYTTRTAVSPVVVGLIRPLIVLPSDFYSRYTQEERALILAHERMHLRRGDLVANAVWSAMRCLLWFNPLTHLATGRFRFDQELACDANTLKDPARSRKTYATAMLKTLLPESSAPVSSSWQASHPLQQRLWDLRNPALHSRRMLGHVLIGLLLGVLGYGAWGLQPAAAYRLAAQQPAAAMCPLEAKTVRWTAGRGVRPRSHSDFGSTLGR
jgi:beta-lactamase regulating signal transducer with metallopeptidase domain